jgi:hypothetical protein
MSVRLQHRHRQWVRSPEYGSYFSAVNPSIQGLGVFGGSVGQVNGIISLHFNLMSSSMAGYASRCGSSSCRNHISRRLWSLRRWQCRLFHPEQYTQFGPRNRYCPWRFGCWRNHVSYSYRCSDRRCSRNGNGECSTNGWICRRRCIRRCSGLIVPILQI